MRSRKVLSINLDGFRLECVRLSEGRNPFRVYRVWTGHRRQIAKYGDFFSVICFLRELYLEGADTMRMDELIGWAKERGSIW